VLPVKAPATGLPYVPAKSATGSTLSGGQANTQQIASPAALPAEIPPPQQRDKPKEKKGFMDKLKGIFK
jgi:hypothetical protein